MAQNGITINFDIDLTKKQKEAYDIIHLQETKFLVARWSRQCGKTVLAEILLIEALCKKDTFSAYISPNFSQGKKVFSELTKLLENTGLIKQSNASELKIESIYGATLKFFSMESPISIRGYTCSGLLVLDEAAYFPTALPNGEDPFYNVIYPIIKARKPKVLIISTPFGKQGIFYDLWLRAFKGEKGYKEITATIYDDELISKEEIEELRKNYPPMAWRQEFECVFLDATSTVFPSFTECFDIEKIKEGVRCWIGIDPSSTEGNDHTILTVVNEQNEVRQYNVEGDLQSKYRQLAEICNRYNPVGIYMEDNGIGLPMSEQVRKLLKRKAAFHTFTTTNDTKKNYIGLIQVAIARKDIHFEKSNKMLYSELGTYSYKLTKNSNITFAARSGFNDDTISSLGLALQCREDIKYNIMTPNNFVYAGNDFVY